MKEEAVGEQGGEEAAAAATTTAELPNSTTSAMEINGGEEGPDFGAPLPHSVSTQRPLEHLMRDITLEAKDGDIIFPITPVGRLPPYDHKVSAENRKKAEEAMKKICSLHLQAIYNAGAVRQVDQILVELLMAQFTRVNQMIMADLNTSLQELFTVMEASGDTLLGELKTALGPMVSNLVPYNLQQVVESHNSRLYMSLTKVLVFLDSARQEGHDFLENLVKSLQTKEELKKLVTALSRWISAFEDHVWELALSKELAEEEVALCVNLALTTTRPVIGNYFSGVLEGLMGNLGIKVHENEDPPCSTQEGLERCLAEELQQSTASAPSLKGCKSQGLHVGYSLEYVDSEKGPSVPALLSMALRDLLDTINHLRLDMSTPSDEDECSEEQQDLLESLAVRGVLKSSKTKDVYQKFVSILDAWPRIQNPVPAPKLRGQVDPPPTSDQRNPPPNSGASSGSNWELGRIPTDEEEPKKLFSYRNPLYTKPSVPPPKVSHPILPIPRKESKAGKEELGKNDPSRSGSAPTGHAGNTPADHSQGDPSLDKMPKQGASSQEVVKPTKGILHPSKSPCPRPTVAAWCSNSCDFLNIISRIAPLPTPVEWVERTGACTCCW